ncbi:MAG: hypothetical protein GQ527_10425 [Bacteroidales bacterium]|nr:hypothetical protein [Bacteroidales bacterium]
MKKLLSLTLILFLSLGLNAQNSFIEASIDNSCNTKPATLNIANGKTASGFAIESLTAGNNCHSGARFTDIGFVIKKSSGDLVFKYTKNNGTVYQPNGDLSQLKLGAGIYYIYVDGGRGAYLKLKFNL